MPINPQVRSLGMSLGCFCTQRSELMTRSLASLLCLGLTIIMSGCAREVFLDRSDLDKARIVPRFVETDPNIGVAHPVNGFDEAPPTVTFADRPPRHIS